MDSNFTMKGAWQMSVELYPDHKAILNFHDSLKVYEVDFLDHLTAFLSQDAYADRQFDLYVKPSLHHSAFDFIVVEPNHALYFIQTPEVAADYDAVREAFDYFYYHRLHSLSPTLERNLRKSAQQDTLRIKKVLYLYDEAIQEELPEDVTKLVSVDFDQHSEQLMEIFKPEENQIFRLTKTESHEIKNALNPNTNLPYYISKSLPREYLVHAQSRTQTKQKFKGKSGSGKTLVLAKRVISCANRLTNAGKILVVTGNTFNLRYLKDLITAEAGRSLQELGVDVSSYQELGPAKEKYQALFIDDAEYFESEWFHQLLDNYLVEMTEDTDYEYVVMANEDYLPKVPTIFGRFITLPLEIGKVSRLLNMSREIFLDILSN